ncbi:MAG: TIGR01777 family protein, partial [Nitrospinae bacterium CG11_big_fil_rev_8_21_14_0_20_56_8]
MKVLVTGATGFVGHRLLLLLREKGHEPVVLSRDVDQAWVRLPLHCSVISWNPLAGDPPLKAFEGIEAVVHLAGESVAEGRWTPPRKDKIRRSRIESTRRLVHAMRQASPRPAVFLCASAIGYYGMDPRAEFTETSPSGEGFLAEVCREWEKEAFGAAEAGVRTVVLRIGLVLGDHGGAMARILPPFRAGLGGPLGNGTQWMSWIHRDDLAGLIVHALEHPTVEGGVNAVAPQPVTNAEFTRCLARELRKPAFLPAPASVLRL